MPVFVIKQGKEPPSFTGFFPFWDANFWEADKNFEELKAEASQDENIAMTAQQLASSQKKGIKEPDFNETDKFTYAELTKSVEHLPQGVNPMFKEVKIEAFLSYFFERILFMSNYLQRYLTAEDFEQIMKMSFDEFMSKPKWRQTELKKAVKLF